MSTFTYVVYLADEEGNLIVDGSNNYIAVSNQEVNIDPAYRAIGGQLACYCKKVYTFSVLKRNSEWILKINRNKFIGKYPTQVAALSVLYGIMTHNDGLDSSFEAWLQDGLDKQISIIDEDLFTPFSINSEGWDSDLTISGTITDGVDPIFDFTKSSLSIQRSGYTSIGTATTRTINSALQNVVRLPYPDQADKDTVNGSGTFVTRVANDKWIYNTDTVTGSLASGFDEGVTGETILTVTNNSTLSVPPVIANWACPVVDYVHDNDLTVDLTAAHFSASNGNLGIACVKFSLYKNGSTKPAQVVTVTSTTTRTSGTTGLSYPVFTHTFDITTDLDGTAYEISAEVFPIWGTSKSSTSVGFTSSDRMTYPNEFYTILRWKDAGLVIPRVYVDATGSDSNDGSIGSPFATLEAAVNSLYATDGTDTEGIIKCNGNIGIFGLNQNIARVNPTYPLKIMADTSATVVGGALGSGKQYFRNNAHVIIENITFDYSTADDSLYGNGVDPGFATLWGNAAFHVSPRVAFKNCTFNSGANTGSSGYIFVYLTLDFFECSTTDGMACNAFFATNANPVGLYRIPGFMIGSHDYTSTGDSFVVALASEKNGLHSPTVPDLSLWAASSHPARTNNNTITGWNKFYQTASGNKALSITSGNDHLVVCNWLEQVLGYTAVAPAVGVYNDGVLTPCDNVLLWHNSVLGQRTNLFYNDEGTAAVLRTNVQVKGNLFSSTYIKSDTFSHPADGPNGNRVGNWGPMNMVEWSGNAAPYTGLSFSFDFETAKTYFSVIKDVFDSYPADGTRSVGDAPVPAANNWATTTGWTWSTAESPIPVLSDGTFPSVIGCIAAAV